MARLNLEIPEELKRRAKVKAAYEQRTLTDVVERLLKDWLEARDHGTRRRRLTLGAYKLGVTGSLSRREIYEGPSLTPACSSTRWTGSAPSMTSPRACSGSRGTRASSKPTAPTRCWPSSTRR